MNTLNRFAYSNVSSISQLSAAILGSYVAGLPNYENRCRQMTNAFAYYMFLPLSVICHAQPIHSDYQTPEPYQLTDEQKVLYYLLRNYERTVRPTRKAADTIVVKLGLTLTNIFDVDEKNQVLTTNVWLDQEWNDELLRWDPKKFNNIESIRVPCDLLWLPDIVLYNNADDYTKGYMKSRAMVYHDGTVFWPLPTQLRSTCKIDVTYFPFDSQYCFLKFGSWTYHGFQVDITNRSDNVDLSNYVISGEFDLINVQQRRRVARYSCCPEPYPDVTFFIHVRRKTLYYMYNVVFPCMMMSALTLLVFCLPPDSGEKIAMGITVLLAFSVFVLAIAEKMPETSDSMPLIGIYLTIVMAMTSVSVVMTVMVLNFHHRGPFYKELPHWLRWLVLGKLRRVLCTQSHVDSSPQMRKPYSHVTTSRRISMKAALTRLQDQFLKEIPSAPDIDTFTVGNETYQARLYTNPQVAPFDGSTPADRYSSCAVCRGGGQSGQQGRAPGALQGEVMKMLKMLICRQEMEDDWEDVANEWRQVAQVVDRLLFWIFLVATFSVTVIVLIVIPLARQSSDANSLDGWIVQLYLNNNWTIVAV